MRKIKTEMEEWKDVDGYEGIYQVSSMGNIRSLDRKITQFCHKNYFTRNMNGRTIKSKTQNSGYEIVWLSKNGNVRAFTVHRIALVAFTGFTPIGLDINHIDGDKRNNKIENIEWCSKSENIKHSYKNLKRESTGKKVMCIELGIVFDSSKQASDIMNINVSGIKHVTNGSAKTSGGYTWKKI